jgi:hypothetical protein
VRPWIKLHRRISAKLQKCHPYTRAIAWEILRHADDEGRIPLEGSTPVECLSRLLGSDRRMRNALPGDVAELVRIGMLAVVGDDLVFLSFDTHQDGVRRGAQERRQSDVSATSVEPQCDLSATSVERQSDLSRTSVVPQSSVSRASVEPQHEAKSSESLNTGPGDRDKIREDKTRSDETKSVRASDRGLLISAPPPTGTRADLVRLIAERYGERFKAKTARAWLGRSQLEAILRGAPALPHRDLAEQLTVVAEWAAEQGDPAAAIDEALAGAFADSWMAANTYPFAALAKGLAKYSAAGAIAAKRERQEARAKSLAKTSEREHDEKVAKDRADWQRRPPHVTAVCLGVT